MKALTIRQPWVHAILREGKNIENRTWQVDYRGWLAIHAAAVPALNAVYPRGVRVPNLDGLDYGAICGVARVVDIVTASRSKWFTARDDGKVNLGWVLEDVIALKKPIPCTGGLGLWNLPHDVLSKLRRQIPKLKFDG